MNLFNSVPTLKFTHTQLLTILTNVLVDCKLPQNINEINDFTQRILNDHVYASITGPCDSYYHYNPVSNTCIRPVQSTRDWVYARDTYCYGYYRTKLITFSSDESLQWFDAWFKDEEFPMDGKFKSCNMDSLMH